MVGLPVEASMSQPNVSFYTSIAKTGRCATGQLYSLRSAGLGVLLSRNQSNRSIMTLRGLGRALGGLAPSVRRGSDPPVRRQARA